MDRIEETLAQKGIRITPMRQLLLEYFQTGGGAVGLKQLEEAFPKADRITMYRTLKTFEEKGLIHQIETSGSELKYAICNEKCAESQHYDRHPHFHCEQCGQIYCLEDVFIPQVNLPEGFRWSSVSMTFQGKCKSCES